MANEEKVIDTVMLADLIWIQKQLKTMGEGYDKQKAGESLEQSVEFVKGALFERAQIAAFAGEFLRELSSARSFGSYNSSWPKRASEILKRLSR